MSIVRSMLNKSGIRVADPPKMPEGVPVMGGLRAFSRLTRPRIYFGTDQLTAFSP